MSCLGHSHPAVIQAIKDQLDRLPYAHTSFFTSEPSEALAEHLIARAPDGLAKVYYVSGGSEANETAIKLARQYFVETGRPERYRFIARRQSYHGNTLGALAVGGNMARREMFKPLLMEVSHITPCYAYRCKEPGESDAAFGRRAADELETEILRLGPETVAAFVAEPVVGATSGAVPPVPGYFARIREICDTYGVLLILDEIMCGMGRTGTLFACEQEGIAPDIVTFAKGLGAGYLPIGAVLVTGDIFEAIAAGTGFFQHGFTYIGHPMACAAARGPVSGNKTYTADRSEVTSFCTQVAEVEVDPETGQILVTKIITAHDVGTVINPLTHQGQIDGGVIQGLGYALMEELATEEGRISTLSLGDYKIPVISDVPRLETVLLESQSGPTPYNGKGIGESSNVPVAPAIANAVADAIGARVLSLPVTAEKVLAALKMKAEN